jgi:hypothetical protein
MRNLPVNIDRLIDAALNHLHHRLPDLDLLALCNFRCLRRCVANTLSRLGWQQGLLEYLDAALAQFPDPSGQGNGGVLVRLMGE